MNSCTAVFLWHPVKVVYGIYAYLCSMKLNTELEKYIEKEILPRYDHFDKAHQRDHALSVIHESLVLAESYPVNPDMVYAIAAFHDTGLAENRERHHLISGHIIRHDDTLKTFFTPEEIEVMAQAAEDHRASSNHPPRSIYGCIVAEADRLIDAHTITSRTIQFSLSHYPMLDKEGHYQRFCEHMKEKYADGGYLKCYIPESDNATRLKAFRALLQNPQQTRSLFEEEWDKLEAEA